jgi:hypothetical protein
LAPFAGASVGLVFLLGIGLCSFGMKQGERFSCVGQVLW